MSMDEMLLNELYGSEEVQQEEQIKQAQVELVEAVAAEAGVDLNELDDEELAKFAHYVLSDEDEHDEYVEYDSDLDKIAALEQADMMGRQMAHSYVDEIQNINEGDQMYDSAFTKIASAMDDVAEAWDLEKIALSAEEVRMMVNNPGGPGAGDTRRMSPLALQYAEMEARAGTEAPRPRKRTPGVGGHDIELPRRASNAGTDEGRKMVADYYERQHRANPNIKRPGDVKGPGMFSGKGKYIAGGLAGAAALGGGLYYMKKRREAQKKTAAFLDQGYEALALIHAYEPEEFAKEAEFRAAEILIANGVDPETFEDVYPENVKIASFPGVEDAYDHTEAEMVAEYNDMLDAAAMHIIENILD